MQTQERKRIETATKWAMRDFKVEELEEAYLGIIKKTYEQGELSEFNNAVNRAKKIIKRKERRLIYRLIMAAKRAKVNVYGSPIDIFEKELLAKHKELYSLLKQMVVNDKPNDLELSTLIPQAIEIEKEIITDIRALYKSLVDVE